MATVYIPKGRKHYVVEYHDENGKRHREHTGTTDKATAEWVARDIENRRALRKAGIISGEDEKIRDEALRPLAAHLADWHRDLLARGKTAKHADQYRDRAGKLIAIVKGRRLAELVPGRKAEAMARAAKLLADTLAKSYFSDLTSEKIQAALAALRDGDLSAQTANHFRAAIRAFLRWCYDKGRIKSVPMKGVESYNVDEDLRHVRRSLTDDELSKLITHADSGPVRWGMPGSLRAMAYRVAAYTGFRVEELRSLAPESFRLNGVRPTIFLRASSTKNRRPADQPIPRALADMLRQWLQYKTAGESVFPLHHETAKAIQADLRAIKVPYVTEEGAADFHSLRAYYVSSLIRSGRSIKEVQTLARHAKPETTLKHYAKVAIHDLHSAVDSLPVLGSEAPALAATGTDHAQPIRMITTPQDSSARHKP